MMDELSHSGIQQKKTKKTCEIDWQPQNGRDRKADVWLNVFH